MNERFAFDLRQAAAAGAPAFVAGVDEAGRGALAGPLVAAAVSFDYRGWKKQDYTALQALNDSKLLTRERREQLFAEILPRAPQMCVVVCAPASIDTRGLHVCNLEALGAALQGLAAAPGLAFVDGFSLPACTVAHQALVGGDARSAVVAAASVVAKVTRDRLMRSLHAQYPQWGFEEHVGYATCAHRDAILEHGICALHRRCFNSIAYQQLELGWCDGPEDCESALDGLLEDKAAGTGRSSAD